MDEQSARMLGETYVKARNWAKEHKRQREEKEKQQPKK